MPQVVPRKGRVSLLVVCYKWMHITSVKLRSLWSARSKGSSICSPWVLIMLLITYALGAQLVNLLSSDLQALVRGLWESLVRSVKMLTVSLRLLEISLSKNTNFSSSLHRTKNKSIKHNQVRFKIQQTYFSKM